MQVLGVLVDVNILDYEARVRVQSNALGGGGEAKIRFDTCATQVC